MFLRNMVSDSSATSGYAEKWVQRYTFIFNCASFLRKMMATPIFFLIFVAT